MVSEKFPPDIMHDVLKGTIPHVIMLILQQFHCEKTVTIHEFNTQLNKLCFGQDDKKQKPVPLKQLVLHDADLGTRESNRNVDSLSPPSSDWHICSQRQPTLTSVPTSEEPL